MSRLENADQLLDAVIRMGSQGVAELAPDDEPSFFRQFLVIPRHLRVLDPQVRLIIGDKGAGKSQLFKALRFEQGRKLLARTAEASGFLTPGDADWLVGFETSGVDFPAPDLLETYARDRRPEELRLLWLGLLGRALLRAGILSSSGFPEALKSALSGPHNVQALGRALAAIECQEPLFDALDKADQALASRQRYVFLVYDELDKVSPGNWDIIRSALQGLIQLWAVYSRRWQRIRCKIFLRRDLYERAALRGPDIAKIAWHPADLLWTPADLYRLLFKRLANAGDEMRTYLQKGRLRLSQDQLLGWVPEGTEEEDFAPTVKHMFGEYMGAAAHKGLTLRWIPNHIKDGHGRVFPRPLLRLMEEAAVIEKRNHLAAKPALIHHTALRGALDRVSEFRVEELEREEFPWMKRVKRALGERPVTLPVERREFLRSLAIDWMGETYKPPETDPGDLLDYLVELGIAAQREDSHQGRRIDVGDLYLKGLNLKRKGGVSRPKV